MRNPIDEGERRRAAVNRALRLSDAIECLKAEMIEEVRVEW